MFPVSWIAKVIGTNRFEHPGNVWEAWTRMRHPGLLERYIDRVRTSLAVPAVLDAAPSAAAAAPPPSSTANEQAYVAALKARQDEGPLAALALARLSAIETEGFEVQAAKRQRIAAETEAADAVTRANCASGISREDRALALYEAMPGGQAVVDRQRSLRTTIEPGGILVCGRVDGVTADGQTLVEVKCRMKRLFRRVYEYEKTQVQAYMHMSGLRKAVLVEEYGGEIHVNPCPYDPAYWTDVIEPGLRRWVRAHDRFRGDEALLLRFADLCIAGDFSAKTDFVQALLNDPGADATPNGRPHDEHDV